MLEIPESRLGSTCEALESELKTTRLEIQILVKFIPHTKGNQVAVLQGVFITGEIAVKAEF